MELATGLFLGILGLICVLALAVATSDREDD
jgi:hypothetical protein